MSQTIWKLENTTKHYDWGSIDGITNFFGIANPTSQPMAEIWMGAHPLGCSLVFDAKQGKIRLDKLIQENPEQMLGAKTYQNFASLPFLFKILSANKALSIQVHPTLENAKLGFAKENQLGIALDAANRNYKDPNHKPELIYALTPYKAMRSFRQIEEIVTLFEKVAIPDLIEPISQLASNQHPDQLKHFFAYLLNLSESVKNSLIEQLLLKISSFVEEPYLTIKTLANDYPNDIGLFMPLLLNVIELQPGQAMFLSAKTPHAYLSGTGLEIMANSDNVLRAGLTHKHIDSSELINNTDFTSLALNQLLTKPIVKDNKIDFPVPVNDFKFEIIQSDENIRNEKVDSAQILLCLDGKVTLSTDTESLTLQKGESAFIAYQTGLYSYTGVGVLAKAFD